jgi:uncharacterized protein DUF3800
VWDRFNAQRSSERLVAPFLGLALGVVTLFRCHRSEDTLLRSQKISEEETKLHHVFADETCQENHDWMGLGTTGVSDEHLKHVRAMFLAWKKKMGLQGEIKWEYTDKKNVERYKTMATVYFNLLKRDILQFHAMTIPMADFDPQALGDDVPEAGYNRCFHHLLLWKYCSRSMMERKYFVFFDKRTSKVPWQPFRLAICRAAAKRYGMDHWPFRRMEYEDSKLEIMLQVNDLILGAVGFWWNKKHTTAPTATSPKADLARHIKDATGYHSLFSIPYHSKRFTIWELTFNDRTREPRMP